MEIIQVGQEFTRDQIDDVYKEITEKDSLQTKWTFGITIDNQMFFRFGGYELFRDNSKQEEIYVCIRTPLSKADLDKSRFFTSSLHSKEARKKASYYQRYDPQSREARRRQEKGIKEV